MQDAQQQMRCQNCLLSPAAVCTEYAGCQLLVQLVCKPWVVWAVTLANCQASPFGTPRECQALSVFDVIWVVIDIQGTEQATVNHLSNGNSK
jgi:hypothetical protein